MIYKDKDQSEIDGILQVIPEAFESKVGTPLDFNIVQTYLADLLKKKELELIDSMLGNLSPKSIRLMQVNIQKMHNGKVNYTQNANELNPLQNSDNKASKKKNFL